MARATHSSRGYLKVAQERVEKLMSRIAGIIVKYGIDGLFMSTTMAACAARQGGRNAGRPEGADGYIRKGMIK